MSDHHRCIRCEEFKPVDVFPPDTRYRSGHHPWCRPCRSIQSAAYQKRRRQDPARKSEIQAMDRAQWAKVKGNPTLLSDARRRRVESGRRLRTAVLDAYGGVCACCGEDTWEFLAIDHIEGYTAGPRAASPLYRWLRTNGYPAGFQVLCHNCNSAKAWYGACPHQRSRRAALVPQGGAA